MEMSKIEREKAQEREKEQRRRNQLNEMNLRQIDEFRARKRQEKDNEIMAGKMMIARAEEEGRRADAANVKKKSNYLNELRQDIKRRQDARSYAREQEK